MKQAFLIALLFICLTTISLAKRVKKSLKKGVLLNDFKELKLHSKGHLKLKDIGANSHEVWACAQDGKLYRKGAKLIAHVDPVLDTKLKCQRVAVDARGYPWVVMTTGEIYQLQEYSKASPTRPTLGWKKPANVCSKKGDNSCAVDVGCSDRGECVYLRKDGSVGIFRGYSFDKILNSKYKKTGKSIDAGLGGSGTVAFTVANNGDLYRVEPSKSTKLLSHVSDVTVSYDNRVITVGSDGILTHKKNSNSFYKLHYEVADRLAAGKDLWLVLKDTFPYMALEKDVAAR